MVRTKEWHARRSRVCHWCSYHILTSSVIYYWKNARQHGIYLFYIITKNPFYFKIFQHNAKAGLCPAIAHFGEDKKQPFDVIYDLYKMKQFHWLLCVANNCDWSRKITPLSNLTQASLLIEWNLQRKQNWTAKSTNLEENAGKSKSVFVIRAALWAEKLGRCLENCRSWKNTLGKLMVAVNLEAISFEFWMKGA